ncbi:hypothetical protein C5167_026012 [Papaver somniferum]|uniref:probable choline kinase 2 n=1 Tax=Papaver somniferum TaxID=3469 RepID=UPI000E6F48A2|nr:probable choline kinase 2 [Papaver somniferum]RZC93397.1 hypothetical protein C5167_026012 [Papaver somniferum]
MGEESVMEEHSVDRIPREATKILISLASSWGDTIDKNSFKVIPLKGAMTNQVYRINWETHKGESPADQKEVLVRIYGQGVDVFFNRQVEINTFECMSKHGQGPRLLGRFSNGRIEEFIHARTLSAHDLRDPEISCKIASTLKEIHKLQMPGPKNVVLWNRLRNWLSSAEQLCPLEEGRVFKLDGLDEEITILEKQFSGKNQLIGLCHNDLQYGNIMMNEDTKLLTIIDYEYASYNPVAYDIANHFCEMAADYQSELPHILDFNKYPELDERKRFIRAYLSSSGDEPTDVDVDALVEDVEKYTLASHLVWGLWGIISEYKNDIDFDYMEYAKQRFQQYQLRKAKLLVMNSSSRIGVVTDRP